MAQSFAERLERDLTDRTQLPEEVRAQLETWLKADRDFNVWFLVTTKRALRDDELTALLEGYQESQEIVEEAWQKFDESLSAKGLFTGERAATKALFEAITRSLAAMEKLRGSF